MAGKLTVKNRCIEKYSDITLNFNGSYYPLGFCQEQTFILNEDSSLEVIDPKGKIAETFLFRVNSRSTVVINNDGRSIIANVTEQSFSEADETLECNEIKETPNETPNETVTSAHTDDNDTQKEATYSTILVGNTITNSLHAASIVYLIIGCLLFLITLISNISIYSQALETIDSNYLDKTIKSYDCNHSYTAFCHEFGYSAYTSHDTEYRNYFHKVHPDLNSYKTCYMSKHDSSFFETIIFNPIYILPLFFIAGFYFSRREAEKNRGRFLILYAQRIYGTALPSNDKREIYLKDIKAIYPRGNRVCVETTSNELVAFGRFSNAKAICVATNNIICPQKPTADTAKVVFDLKGRRGRRITVYENKCVITTKITFWSLVTHTWNNGEKTIYYSDVIGIQFRDVGIITLGYLQLETANTMSSHLHSNFFNENTFLFNDAQSLQMQTVVSYIKSKIEQIKNDQTAFFSNKHN